jgi:hypothetical protein
LYFASGSCFILTCYETVHRTVSAKFINEFGASCLLCFAQFTPPNKRQKAQKIAWTRCPSYFSIPPSATSCTHRLTCWFGRCFCTLCRGLHRRPAPFTREAKKVCLIPGSSKSVSFLGRGEMNGVFIINFVKFIQTRNFFRRGAL